MKKRTKTTLGILAIAMIALLGVSGIVAANGGFVFSKELTDEEKTEMQEQMDAMQTAIANMDYDAWKSLMEEKIAKMQEQITEENFNKIIEMHKQEEEKRAEMQAEREQFCEENDCPVFEDGEFPKDFKEHHRIGDDFGMPFPNSNEN